jgi:hypothetical protein
MPFSVKKLFSADDASLSIVWSLGLKPRDVNSWKMPPNDFNHSDVDLDFIAMGFI